MTWESYLITVSVVNNVGIGPASEIVKVRTLEGVPSRAPTILKSEAVNSTAISLAWQGPASAYINGILNSFKVLTMFIRRRDPTVISFQIELIDWTRNISIHQEQQAKPIEMYQLTIGQLKKYTNYSLRMNCATKIGSGPWSTPTVYLQTLEDGKWSPSSTDWNHRSDRFLQSPIKWRISLSPMSTILPWTSPGKHHLKSTVIWLAMNSNGILWTAPRSILRPIVRRSKSNLSWRRTRSRTCRPPLGTRSVCEQRREKATAWNVQLRLNQVIRLRCLRHRITSKWSLLTNDRRRWNSLLVTLARRIFFVTSFKYRREATVLNGRISK